MANPDLLADAELLMSIVQTDPEENQSTIYNSNVAPIQEVVKQEWLDGTYLKLIPVFFKWERVKWVLGFLPKFCQMELELRNGNSRTLSYLVWFAPPHTLVEEDLFKAVVADVTLNPFTETVPWKTYGVIPRSISYAQFGQKALGHLAFEVNTIRKFSISSTSPPLIYKNPLIYLIHATFACWMYCYNEFFNVYIKDPKSKLYISFLVGWVSYKLKHETIPIVIVLPRQMNLYIPFVELFGPKDDLDQDLIGVLQNDSPMPLWGYWVARQTVRARFERFAARFSQAFQDEVGSLMELKEQYDEMEAPTKDMERVIVNNVTKIHIGAELDSQTNFQEIFNKLTI